MAVRSMNTPFEQFRRQVSNPFWFRIFLLQKLPSAFLAGLRISSVTEESATVSASYGWITRNPFRSMYFAVQSMAAELSTGLLASGHVYKRKPAISMLVTGLEARFLKRVTGRVSFTCKDGKAIAAAINDSVGAGEGRTVTCISTGVDELGETVSEFRITWSFKPRTQKGTTDKKG